MKKCPVCKMIVDADSSCPICYTTITWEPEVEAKKEKLVFNKYLVLYFLRQSWFSLICLAIFLYQMITLQAEIDAYVLMIVVLLVISFVNSISYRRQTALFQRKYSEEYAELKVQQGKIYTGVLAVLLSLLMHFMYLE